VLLLVSLLGPVLTWMPMAALAGTLFIVGANMIKWRDVQHYAQVRSELILYLATFLCIVFFGLAAGVMVAVVLSVTAFLLTISRLELREESTQTGTLLRVRGALFYASLETLSEAFHRHLQGDLTVDLQYATHIDQSAVDFFAREAAQMSSRGQTLRLLVNATQGHFLQSMGVGEKVRLQALQDDVPPASLPFANIHSATLTGETP